MSRNKRKFEQYQDMIARLYPELANHNTESKSQSHGDKRILARTVTLQVTDRCNLACTYCYQINKGVRRMSFETAKKFIDLLLTGEKGFNHYVDPSFSPAIILEFIGGEPFLEIELIDKVCDYFVDRLIELKHPWAKNFRFSICSNGVLYRDPKVQKFLNKWKNKLSFSITIDGDKELHDTCRVFPDGSPSYDIAIDGAKDWMSKGNYMGSKITIAPENLHCFSRAIKHMISLGYEEINCNCVYEDVWKPKHGKQLYDQLKETADYLLDNNLENDIYVSILAEDNFHPKATSDLQTWCWGKGTPILTTKGYKPIEDIVVGDEVKTVQGNWKSVIKTSHHFADNCVSFRVEDNPTMVATFDHKLYGKFRAIGHPFSEGDAEPYTIEELIKGKEVDGAWGNGYVQTTDGLKLLASVTVTDPQEVYNITVADDHSYIAGSLASKNCGGLGDMLACDPDGKLFPCIRYMESSLGNTVPPVIIGDVDNGVCQRPHEQKLLCDMCAVNRRTFNTDECFYCPIYQGCAECSAYNYQLSGGDFNKRATCICITHKARCLANAYYWAKFYEKNEPQSKFKFYMPDEWALQVIDKDELDMIKSLPNIELCQTTWQELRDKDLNGEDKQKEEVQ